jgi:hypothetical protein
VLAVFRGHGGEYLPDGGADRGVDDDVGGCGDFGKIAGEQASCRSRSAVATSRLLAAPPSQPLA